MKIHNKTLLLIIVASVLVGILMPTDDTDKSRFERSGMHLYTDYGTGCQYLAGAGWFGKQVLIPRVDRDGKHVCK